VSPPDAFLSTNVDLSNICVFRIWTFPSSVVLQWVYILICKMHYFNFSTF
jgi:hypothetical protein